MKKLNHKGFGVIEGILILVLLGIIGGTGYYVYTQNKETGNKESVTSQQPSEKTETIKPKLDVDESKVPQGWFSSNNSDSLVTLDNSAMDRKPSENCFAEVEIINDKDARITGNTADEKNTNTEKYADKLRQNRNSKIKSDKGYQVSVPDLLNNPSEVTVGEPSGEFNTSEGLNSYPFYSEEVYKLTLPSDPEATLYQQVGFIIRDGYYVSVVQSCHSGDLTDAYKALKAVKVDIESLR